MAISRVNSTTYGTSGPSITYAFDCTGSNILIVGLSLGSSNTCSGITYNGISMTQLNTQNIGGSTFMNTYLFYLINPATGSNNVVVSTSGTGFHWGYASCFSGVDLSAPFSPATGTTTNGTNTALTTTMATSYNGEYVYGIVQNGSADVAFTAGANSTIISAHANGWGCHFTGSGLIAPGSNSNTINRNSSGLFGINAVAMTPLSEKKFKPGSLGSML